MAFIECRIWSRPDGDETLNSPSLRCAVARLGSQVLCEMVITNKRFELHNLKFSAQVIWKIALKVYKNTILRWPQWVEKRKLHTDKGYCPSGFVSMSCALPNAGRILLVICFKLVLVCEFFPTKTIRYLGSTYKGYFYSFKLLLSHYN